MNDIATGEEKLYRFKGNNTAKAGREGTHKTHKGTVKDIKNNKNDKESMVSAKPKQSLRMIAQHYQRIKNQLMKLTGI